MSDDKLLVDRSSIAKECEECEKKERYRVIKINPGDTIPNPASLLLSDDEARCVLVRESRVDGLDFLLFKCNDSDCLIKTLREAVVIYWMQEQQRKLNEKILKSRSGHLQSARSSYTKKRKRR